MGLTRAETFGDYLELLRNNAEELGMLFEDLLITVTEFFRDPDVFKTLQRNVIPVIISGLASQSDLCVFARQDVINDPPFSNMNLVSCRSLLIYLDPLTQKEVLYKLHYALNLRASSCSEPPNPSAQRRNYSPRFSTPKGFT